MTGTEKKIRAFVDMYGYGIIPSITNTGLFFPTVIAQSCWESGYGAKIPPGSNNFAGIKYDSNNPLHKGYVLVDTSEYINGKKVIIKAKFAKFNSVKEGFDAHIKLLITKPRYASARLDAKDPIQQIKMLAEAGYSSTPPDKYANQMKPLVRACQDYVPLGRIY